MRPRFEFQVPVDAARWLGAVRDELDADRDLCRGQTFRHHAVVEMRAAAKHFWSPYLNLDVEDEPGGSVVRGRFAPHPHVWTLFMAVYILLGIVFLAGIVWGFVQYTMGEAPWGALVAPAAVGLFGFVYGATLIGQGLGAEQMYTMRALVDRATHASLSVVSNDEH